MTAAVLPSPQPPVFVSEIFPLTISQPNILSFRLSPNVNDETRELGNRLSFHLSRTFPDVTVTWYRGDFLALIKPEHAMPDPSEWRAALENIRAEVKDLSDRPWSIQWVRHPDVNPTVLAQLACQILQIDCRFSYTPVLLPSRDDAERVIVRREAEFWSETVDLEGVTTPAISLSVRSSILFKGNLAEFFQSHPARHNPAKLLIGLHVQSIESGGHGVITGIVGTVGEKREDLIEWATGATSKQALREAPNDQPVVAVQFGKKTKVYEYAMAALKPRVTDDTEDRFDVKYGQLLRATKIPFTERTRLLTTYKEEATQVLTNYGFQVGNSINSRRHGSLFWQPPVPIAQTPLLFGNGFVGQQGQILNGLKVRNGGVYRRHPEFESRAIQIAALKLCDFSVNPFLDSMKYCLEQYGFSSNIIHKKPLSISDSGASARVELEKALNELTVLSPDVVLIFLPESDRGADNNDGGSLYQFAYSHLLRRQIASQFIYADTLKRVQSGQILNQVVPGILAKLGNLPFILAEPLEIADYFVGLDISRSPKAKLSGTMNACASIRLYGKQGEFIRYRLEDALLEGEEIPQRLLERLLPSAELEGKTVLIYRDGRFCGKEVAHLLEWERAINAKFILVECTKSGVPRLYNSSQKMLAAPELGLALRLSPGEAILVTTKVSPNVGLARPLRLRVHEEGHIVPIEQVIETTLKLTLLHHGALKTPRLPMPLHGADRMAYLKLNGIYPSILEGDRQFWL